MTSHDLRTHVSAAVARQSSKARASVGERAQGAGRHGAAPRDIDLLQRALARPEERGDELLARARDAGDAEGAEAKGRRGVLAVVVVQVLIGGGCGGGLLGRGPAAAAGACEALGRERERLVAEVLAPRERQPAQRLRAAGQRLGRGVRDRSAVEGERGEAEVPRVRRRGRGGRGGSGGGG